MNIADKSYVTMDYKLTLDSGEEVDRSPDGQPLGFITGSGQIIPGLEKALMGMKPGESSQITVEPEEGYGMVNDNLFHEIPQTQFPDEVEVKPGMTFQANGPQGPIMLTVSKVNDNETVTVDLNHPLAGKRLVFDVNIVDVREATADELAQLNSAGCGCGCGSTDQSSCDPQSGACGPGCCG